MIRVIIESPYAGNVERNTKYARRCMSDCLRRGEAPIASHLLYTQEGILDDKKPEDRSLGLNAGFAWWIAADYIVFYLDYGWSPGMVKAKERCTRFAKSYELRFLFPNPSSDPLV